VLLCDEVGARLNKSGQMLSEYPFPAAEASIS